MNIAVHARDVHPASVALAAGAARVGIRLIFQRPVLKSETVNDADAAIILMAGPTQRQLMREYVSLGIPAYFMELPRLRMASGIDENARTESWGFYRDTLHYVPAAPGGIARVHGVIRQRQPQYVIVCGQKPEDAQHGMSAYQVAAWAGTTIQRARQYGLPVLYRPHPRAVEMMGESERYGADGVSRPSVETLRTALGRCAAVVTYNSTSGLDAIDAGVPVFYTAPADAVAYAPYAQPLGNPLAPLPAAAREECLLRFAACQFTRAEIANGTMFRVVFLGEPHPETRVEVVGGDDQPPVMPEPRRRGRPRKPPVPGDA
jgi:hypothetical protein